jgi:hypothetical protein
MLGVLWDGGDLLAVGFGQKTEVLLERPRLRDI